MEELLSPEEVGERLGVSVYTVRRWIKEGKVRAFRPGKEYRVRVADLEEFFAAREVHPKGAEQPSEAAQVQERREPETHTSGAKLEGTGTLDGGEGLLLIGDEGRKIIEEKALKKILERTARREISANEAMDEVLEKAEIR